MRGLRGVLFALGPLVALGWSRHAARAPASGLNLSGDLVRSALAVIAVDTPAAAAARAPDGPPELPPLEAPRASIDLSVPGFLPARALIPVGATRPRPVVVATHGLGGGPEEVCGVFRDLAGPDVFVLCPRGQRCPDSPDDAPRYRYPTWETLDAEIDAALAALRARFPGRVDEGPALYAGFSQGANMGVAVLAKHPARFRRAVLVEGGEWRWTEARARAYASGGGERVLFACGRPSCAKEAAEKAALLERAGVEVRIAIGERGGHAPGGEVAEATRGAFEWLLAGDERWGRGR